MANTTRPNFDEMSRDQLLRYVRTLASKYNIKGVHWQEMRGQYLQLDAVRQQASGEIDETLGRHQAPDGQFRPRPDRGPVRAPEIRVPEAPHVDLPDLSRIPEPEVRRYAEGLYQSYSKLKKSYEKTKDRVTRLKAGFAEMSRVLGVQPAEHSRRHRIEPSAPPAPDYVVPSAPPAHLMPENLMSRPHPSAPPAPNYVVPSAPLAPDYVEPSAPPAPNYGVSSARSPDGLPPSYEESFRDPTVDPRVAPPTYDEAMRHPVVESALQPQPSAPSIYTVLQVEAENLQRSQRGQEVINSLQSQKPLLAENGTLLPPLQVYCLLTNHDAGMWNDVLTEEAFQDISRMGEDTVEYGWILSVDVPAKLDELDIQLQNRGLDPLSIV